MRDDIVEKIKFPKWWRGVRQGHMGLQKRIRLHAFDTETWLGRVFLTGFFDGESYSYCYGVDKNHADWFFRKLEALSKSSSRHYSDFIAAHNLKFDLGVLLWRMLNPLAHSLPSQKESCFSYLPLKAEVKISWKRPCFMKVKFEDGSSVTVLDTFSFFPTSLRKILKILGGSDQKLETPEEIGNRIIPEKEILPYNKADCVGVYRILEFIHDRHKEFGVRFSISLPQLSARIYRHRFLKNDFVIPPAGALAGALYSYHGGKNTWIGKQGWYDAYDLDVRSAFPEAMLNLPNFAKGSWRPVRKYEGPVGFYKIRGVLRKCPWGVLFSHAFKKLTGSISNIWVTGYELGEAIRTREISDFEIEDGWVFDAEDFTSPFKGFVDFFYSKKESNKGLLRDFYKLTLNALYGKFIQKVLDELDGSFKIGGLFDPTVASLITGSVRSKIHRLEHKYRALHTATDGIITRISPDPRDLSEAIGGLKMENFGPCLILRNKLYLHYDSKGTLVKRGLHGFQGSPEELMKLYDQKQKYYKITRLVSWAESWGMGIPPGGPLERKMVLNCI